MTPSIIALAFVFANTAECLAWKEANIPETEPTPAVNCEVVEDPPQSIPTPPRTSLRPKMRTKS